MEPVTLADYQRGVLRTAFRSAVSRGEAQPLMLLASAVPAIVVPAVFIAVAGRHHMLRPLRYALAAALVAFNFNRLTPLWNSDGSWARTSSINLGSAYGAGIVLSWGTMWALTVLVWTNPWSGERVARRRRRGPPETGPDGYMDPAKAPDEDIARSLRLSHEYYWQSFPQKGSFLARFDWAMDLCLAWRGVAIIIGSYFVLDACAVTMTSDPYFIIGPAPIRNVPWSEQLEHFPHLALGKIDPPPPSPVLFAIPPHLEMLYRHPYLLELYRSLLGLAGMVAALHIVLNIDQVVRVFFGNMIFGPKSMATAATSAQLWHYPSAFGSVWQVFEHGLSSFWGSFWHQTFREGFSAPTHWLIDQGILPGAEEMHDEKPKVEIDTNGMNGQIKVAKNAKVVHGTNGVVKSKPHKRPKVPFITRFIGLAIAFGQSATLHGAASITALPTHTWWQGAALFFILAGIGVVVQSIPMPSCVLNRLPLRARQAVNFGFALIWLHVICRLFIDDQARCGIWLFEPVPFSPVRLIMSLLGNGPVPPIVSSSGSSRAGHSAWRWYHDDLIHWYTGKNWWETGIAL
ncbi:hypothetical protein SEUCBS139899_007200 [Sporothrix eucalyptigena]